MLNDASEWLHIGILTLLCTREKSTASVGLCLAYVFCIRDDALLVYTYTPIYHCVGRQLRVGKLVFTNTLNVYANENMPTEQTNKRKINSTACNFYISLIRSSRAAFVTSTVFSNTDSLIHSGKSSGELRLCDLDHSISFQCMHTMV